jgi:hypothetical protein
LPFVSPETKAEESVLNATTEPSLAKTGELLVVVDWTPLVLTDMRVVVAACRSRKKMSPTLFVSFGTRLVEPEVNTT